jgi:pyruvyltransferase
MTLNRLGWHRDLNKNWGDDLNPYLYEKITGRVPEYTPLVNNAQKYMMIGSILGTAKSNSIVWGSGAMFKHDRVQKGADVRAVRGPLSRDRVLACGVKCPEIYGDPALLVERYYHPKVDKKYKLGIIPHYVDKQHVKLPEGCDDTLVINIGAGIEDFIKHVLSCEMIASSSLHGLVVADAYNIPNIWVRYSKNVAGDGYKFYDHTTAIGVKGYDPVHLIGQVTNPDTLCAQITPHDINLDLDKLMDACPFGE